MLLPEVSPGLVSLDWHPEIASSSTTRSTPVTAVRRGAKEQRKLWEEHSLCAPCPGSVALPLDYLDLPGTEVTNTGQGRAGEPPTLPACWQSLELP